MPTSPNSTEPRHILVVEDDLNLAKLVREFLEQQGFRVSVLNRGDGAVEETLRLSPDLIILDIMLPGKDGLSVCRDLRPLFLGPIILLTARSEENDEIHGLEIGADDYIRKPVRPRVLLARINAHLRRGNNGDQDGRIEVGRLVADTTTRSATLDGEELKLTSGEFELLIFMMKRSGRPVSRDELSLELRGIPYDGIDRTIDLRVSHLRSKLGDKGKKPNLIKSVRGVGYQLIRS